MRISQIRHFSIYPISLYTTSNSLAKLPNSFLFSRGQIFAHVRAEPPLYLHLCEIVFFGRCVKIYPPENFSITQYFKEVVLSNELRENNTEFLKFRGLKLE